MIWVLAFTFTVVFFHRQVRSHLRCCAFGFCDLARRLADKFLATSQPDFSWSLPTIGIQLHARAAASVPFSLLSSRGTRQGCPDTASPPARPPCSAGQRQRIP